MITESEMLKFWGNDLVKVPSKSLDQIKLTEKTKTFLYTIGLPVRDNLLIDFTPNDLKLLYYENSQYVIIAKGRNNNTKVGLQVGTEKIYLFIDIGNQYFVRFVNSDAVSFLIFLQRFEEFYTSITNIPVGEREKIIQELEQKFLEVDPIALSDDNNTWVTTLEELKFDLI